MNPFRAQQRAYSQAHGGRGEAAHYISEMELRYFGVSGRNYNDHFANYRMANFGTNRSYHHDIYRHIMEAHRTRATTIDPFTSVWRGMEFHVSRDALENRLLHKIEAAKATGAIDNDRLYNYLYRSAERLGGLDMRIFNGCSR
jgi:phytoene/squalene synthetase